jgi:hypothetical protein
VEQRRVMVVFSGDESEATVTSEVWQDGERVACLVHPPSLGVDLFVNLANVVSHDDHPTIFD